MGRKQIRKAAASPITPDMAPGRLMAKALMTAGGDLSAAVKPKQQARHSRLRPDSLGVLVRRIIHKVLDLCLSLHPVT